MQRNGLLEPKAQVVGWLRLNLYPIISQLNKLELEVCYQKLVSY